jgi:hypothetical protein
MTLSVHYNSLLTIQNNANSYMKGVISSEKENSKTTETTQEQNSQSPQKNKTR